MKITLEMVDEIISRTNVSYKIAKEALELNDGEVLKTLVYLEDKEKFKSSKKINANEIVEKLKALVNSGMVSQILIERNGKVIVDIPIMAGAISAIIFTVPTVAGIIAAIATGCEIKIVKEDGDQINVNEITQDKLDEFMSKMNKDRKQNCNSKSTPCCDENVPETENKTETETEFDHEDYFVPEDNK